MMQEADYVIIGGGTAGSVLAYRLGEHGYRVCVFEAGPADRNPFIRMPAGYVKTMANPAITWQMAFEPSEGTNNRAVKFVQGRTLGGSSSVNGMIYSRGQALDYDTWAAQGNPGWSSHDTLPYFRKVENFQGADDGDQRRGRQGRMAVGVPGWNNAATEAFIAGAVDCGIPRNPDYNGKEQFGIGYTQSMIYRNARWSAARAYLHPGRRLFNVEVVTGRTVRSLLLDKGRAVGVTFSPGDGLVSQVRARKGVIVSAGAVGSPKLLQLSGIGPGALLQKLDIPVVRDLPGVGENLQDHYVARVVVRARRGVDTMNQRVRGFRLAREVAAWLVGKHSILATSPNVIYGFGKSRNDLPTADFALSYSPASHIGGVLGQLDKEPGLTCGAWQLRPESKGYVRLSSGDPDAAPLVQPNYLDDARDQRVMVEALKCARRIMLSPAMAPIAQAELLPGPDVQSDDDMLNYARQYGSTGYHLTGSCKMGPPSDRLAVVDANLQVHGIERLHVIDASIMPTSPSANTCAPTLMIAEKAADLLLGEAGDGR